MADNPQQAVFTHELFVKNRIADGVLEANVFFDAAKQRGNISYNVGGTEIVHLHHYKTNSVGTWGPLLDETWSQPDNHVRAVHQWGGVFAQYMIDEWDKLANVGQSEALANMQTEFLKNLEDDVNQYYEDYMFLDGLSLSPGGIGGLAAFMKKTGTYGGISQASGNAIGNTRKAQVLDGSVALTGGTLTATDSRYTNTDYPMVKKYWSTLFTRCDRGVKKGGNKIDACFMGRNEWLEMHQAIELQRRVISDSSKIKVGHENFEWMGKPFFWSDSCQANTGYAINFNTIFFKVQTSKLAVSKSHKIPMPMVDVHQLYAKLQMYCDNPRMNGVIISMGY